MGVLMISDVYFPRVNGVSTSIETFRQELEGQGIETTLVAPDYPGTAPEARIHRLPSRAVPRDPEDRIMAWSAASRLAQTLPPGDIDLVHIQTPFVAHYAGVKLARQLGVPVIATYHTFFEEYLYHYLPFLPREWLRGLARRYSRKQCNDLDAVVVPSTAMSERLTSYGVSKPLHVIPTGIPLKRFDHGDRRRFRQQWQIAPERPVALFVGRVAHEKNITFLLEALQHACQRIPDLLLVITGEGPARHSLEKQAQTMGLANNVLFLGYLDRSTGLPDAYAGADVFTFASRTETQGLVLLEAMAAGLPVVALAAMGTKDILAPQRGARIAPDDPQGFAQVLTEVLSQPDLHQALAAEAPVYGAEWSDTALARRMAELYRTLISPKQG